MRGSECPKIPALWKDRYVNLYKYKCPFNCFSLAIHRKKNTQVGSLHRTHHPNDREFIMDSKYPQDDYPRDYKHPQEDHPRNFKHPEDYPRDFKQPSGPNPFRDSQEEPTDLPKDLPPSYALSQATASSSRNASNPISRPANAPNAAYGAGTQDLVLHVYNTGSLFNKQWTITLPDKASTVYVVSVPVRILSSSQPITFCRGSENGPVAGQAQLRYLTTDIDVTVYPDRRAPAAGTSGWAPQHPISTCLRSDGVFSRQHSIALFGQMFKVKHTHQGGTLWSLKFVDGQDRVLAVYASTQGRSWGKLGRIEILAKGLGSEMVDAVVICLLGLAERERERRRRVAVIAAASS